MRKPGFTLIELLVVIAIMVAWVFAMLPVLFRRALRPILVRITREVIAIKSEAKSHR